MDTPRLRPQGDQTFGHGQVPSKDVRTFVQIMMEHNRSPGVFDYNYNQNFYSTYPEIDKEAYLVVGAKGSKGAHKSYEDGQIHSPETKPY